MNVSFSPGEEKEGFFSGLFAAFANREIQSELGECPLQTEHKMMHIHKNISLWILFHAESALCSLHTKHQSNFKLRIEQKYCQRQQHCLLLQYMCYIFLQFSQSREYFCVSKRLPKIFSRALLNKQNNIYLLSRFWFVISCIVSLSIRYLCLHSLHKRTYSAGVCSNYLKFVYENHVIIMWALSCKKSWI